MSPWGREMHSAFETNTSEESLDSVCSRVVGGDFSPCIMSEVFWGEQMKIDMHYVLLPSSF